MGVVQLQASGGESMRSTSRANNSSSRAAVHAGEKQRDAPRRGGPGGSFAPAGRALVGARASDDERHDGNSMSSRHAGSHSNAGGKCLSLQKCVFLFPNLKQFSLVQIALSDRADHNDMILDPYMALTPKRQG